MIFSSFSAITWVLSPDGLVLGPLASSGEPGRWAVSRGHHLSIVLQDMSGKKMEAGFTLIELLLVITIIGVLTGLVTINMAQEVKKYRLKEATALFYSDIKKCRVDAMTDGGVATTRGFGFNFNDASSYNLFRFDDADNDYTYDSGEAQSMQTVNVPNGVQVRRPSGTLTAPFLFDRRGWLRTASWSSAVNGTFILELEGAPSRCVVLTTSRIRQGVWNDPNCNSN